MQSGKELILFSKSKIFYNFKSSNTSRFRASINSIKAGNSHYYLAAIGESNTAGHGAGTGASGNTGDPAPNADTNARVFAWPKLLSDKFTTNLGIPSEHSAHVNLNGYTLAEYLANGYDPQFDFTTTTGLTAPSQSTAGLILTIGSGTNPIKFTPRVPCTKCAVTYIRTGGQDTVDIAVDGGTATTVNAAGSSAILTQEVSAGSLGTHQLTITGQDVAGAFSPLVIEGYDDTRKALRFLNMGRVGASIRASYTTTTNPWSTGSFFSHVAQNWPVAAWIIHLGSNDWSLSGNTDIATFLANYRTMLTALTPYQDVFLSVPFIQSTAIGTLAKQEEISSGIYQVAREYDLPLIDHRKKFVDFSTASSNGYLFDNAHLTQAGQAAYATTYEQAVSIALSR